MGQRHKRTIRIRALGFETYQQYISSPYWRKLRAEIRSLPEFQQCRVCESRSRIILHHVRYEVIGREEPKHLIPLCSKHHKKLHIFIDQHPEYGLKYGTKVWLAENTPRLSLVQRNLLRLVIKSGKMIPL